MPGDAPARAGGHNDPVDSVDERDDQDERCRWHPRRGVGSCTTTPSTHRKGSSGPRRDPELCTCSVWGSSQARHSAGTPPFSRRGSRCPEGWLEVRRHSSEKQLKSSRPSLASFLPATPASATVRAVISVFSIVALFGVPRRLPPVFLPRAMSRLF